MLLLEEGVPSTLRRSAGFDVPDMLAAGPRDVLVPESGLEVARQVLLRERHRGDAAGAGRARRRFGRARARDAAGRLLLAAAVVALLLWLAAQDGLESLPHVPGGPLGAGPDRVPSASRKSRRSPDAVVTSERWSLSLYCVHSATPGTLIAAKLSLDQPGLALLPRAAPAVGGRQMASSGQWLGPEAVDVDSALRQVQARGLPASRAGRATPITLLRAVGAPVGGLRVAVVVMRPGGQAPRRACPDRAGAPAPRS